MIVCLRLSIALRLHVAIVLVAAILASTGIARAQAPLQVLHEFSGYRQSEGPHAPLIEATDGNFYGTTSRGGAFNRGTTFKMTPSGDVTFLHSFAGGNDDGAEPEAALVQGSDGNFYGTTVYGGRRDAGTMFRMDLSGQVDILHSFAGRPEGAFPYSALIQAADGSFYGTTVSGGAFDLGTAFRMTSDGTVAFLHSFAGGPSDGDRPSSPLVQASDGNFYGTTYGGGASPSCSIRYDCGSGTVFRLAADGTVTVLHSFSGGPADGAQPSSALIQASDGNLYGTTRGGGGYGCPSCGPGTFFRVTLAGAITILHVFGDVPGPSGSLLQAQDGNFYGTTEYGSMSGTVFRITAAGAVTLLHTFSGGADGARPVAGLMQAHDGRLYGTTAEGGYPDFGTIFTITAAGAVTILHHFRGSVEGFAPLAPLVQASDGNFYGSTVLGGAYNRGTIFRMSPGGRYTLLYTFAGGLDGGYPVGALVQGRDGNLFGVTYRNGAYDAGTAFVMTLNGEFGTLHWFRGDADGGFPLAGLIQGRDGNFYGTLNGRGAFNGGTVFRMAPNGDTTTLHVFAGAQDGASPAAPLMQAADGNFYGTTISGGGNPGYPYGTAGTVFRITPRGDYAVLHRFDTVNDGAFPNTGLVQGADGYLYGSSSCGKQAGGAMFRMSPSGVFSVLSRNGFVCSTYGPDPVITLVRGEHGIFYGTDRESVFAMTETGVRTTLCAVPDCFSVSPLIQADDGSLYGVGGSSTLYGAGNVFRVTPVAFAPTSVIIGNRRGSGVRLTWAPIPLATSYRIKRGRVRGGELPLATDVIGTSFVDTSATPGDTYYYVVTAVNAFGESANSYEVSITAGRATAGDFDGDGTTDITVFRPSDGRWYIHESSASYATSRILQWGVSEDIPVPADYDGHGRIDIAVYRPASGVWYILKSNTNYTGAIAYGWGVSTDIPVPGDYDGDGRTDIAVYRPSTGTWFILKSSTNYMEGITYGWGTTNDLPVPGDYDGDGRTDLAVYRPSAGTWFVLKSSTNFTGGITYGWGLTTDIPVPGDYDGDGTTDVAVYRPLAGTWLILTSSTNFTTSVSYGWGVSTDTPVPGDYDGDGRTDIAVYRPSYGTWFVLKSNTNFTGGFALQWGNTGDSPAIQK